MRLEVTSMRFRKNNMWAAQANTAAPVDRSVVIEVFGMSVRDCTGSLTPHSQCFSTAC
jgi:hypothetical protein